MLRRLLPYLLLLVSCTQTRRDVSPGFYYWKTTYAPTSMEQAALDSLGAADLFVRLFDVGLDESGKAAPAGKMQWLRKPAGDRTITPVVFITQEALRAGDDSAPDSLAARICRLAAGLLDGIAATDEFQLDCDWTAGTRERYFRLLRAMRGQDFMKGKTLSVTIRLHQLRYAAETGVPPADRGLLMCYNMGNLRAPGKVNSILDYDLLEQYTRTLRDYPLPLDVALPLFDWYVWFSENRYRGIIHHFNSREMQLSDHFEIQRDTMIEGCPFSAGDRIRHERSEVLVLQRAATLLSRRLPAAPLRVLLFDLSEQNLSNYKLHELEAIIGRLRGGSTHAGTGKRF